MAEKLTLPEPSVPLIDPATGKMTEHWYIFLTRLKNAVNALLP